MKIRIACGLLALAFVAPFAAAQNYPVKPVRLIVPYPPGGSTDVVSRAFAQQMSKRVGQQVVIENRPGGSLFIGTVAAAKSPPDGYTLLLASVSSLAINVGTFKKLPYDPIKDFEPISMMFYTPLFLTVGSTIPAKSVKELIAMAKASPGTLSYASLGNGSSLHLAGEMFRNMAGLDLIHVPYKGPAAAVPDLEAGRVTMIFNTGTYLSSAGKPGGLRALATTGPQRVASFPDVPTMAEAGVPGYQVVIWFGLVAPAGTPKNIVARVNKEVTDIVNERAFKEQFLPLGIETGSSTPEAFAELIRTDIPKWETALRNAKIEKE
jgi:tripartite-type tricarboxylate transporter receptor subunit TctC